MLFNEDLFKFPSPTTTATKISFVFHGYRDVITTDQEMIQVIINPEKNGSSRHIDHQQTW
jgi:hypothetical protein